MKTPTTLAELHAALTAKSVKAPRKQLPTFGGDMIDEKGVYSWDETSALVITTAYGVSRWTIVSREDI